MIALVGMRLVAFTRTGHALAPLIGVLVALSVIYSGGPSPAGEAFGFSAAVLFPLLAWQTKILLDVEPDTQRRLAAVVVGSPILEWIAGLVAAAIAALCVVALAIVVPWLFGGVTGPQRPEDPSFEVGMSLGVWAHLLLMVPAIALGALASRAVTRGVRRGLALLVGGSVLTFAVGIKTSPVPWLAPPVMGAARTATQGISHSIAGYTVHALLWTAVALFGYGWLRHHRS